MLPSLVSYSTQGEYRTHFEQIYCKTPISTFDGIQVRFRKTDFNHCFFESTRRNGIKDKFSLKRSERMDWIEAVLMDPNADLRDGWDKKKKRYDNSRRVALVVGPYVVVIALQKNNATKAKFITAYVADSDTTVKKIMKSPVWSG